MICVFLNMVLKLHLKSAKMIWSNQKGIEMIRFRLKELMAEKEFQDGKRLTLEQVSKATEIHRTTLSKIANNKGYNATTDILDKLCEYFDVELGQVAEYIKNK